MAKTKPATTHAAKTSKASSKNIATKPAGKHRYSQFMAFPLHAKVVDFVKKQKAQGVHTSVTQVMEELAHQRFIGRRPIKAL